MSTSMFDPKKSNTLILVVHSGDRVTLWLGLYAGNIHTLIAKEVVHGPATKAFNIPQRDSDRIRWSIAFEPGELETGRVDFLLSEDGEAPRLVATLGPVAPERRSEIHRGFLDSTTGRRAEIIERVSDQPDVQITGGSAGSILLGRDVGSDILICSPSASPPPAAPPPPPRPQSPRKGKFRLPKLGRLHRQSNALTKPRQLYRVWFGTNRQPAPDLPPSSPFTDQRDSAVHHGFCDVFIPASHKIGSLGSSFWKRLLTRKDDRLELRHIIELPESKFWKQVAKACQSIPEDDRQAVVYIHGYNTSFHEAALRAAQLGCDLSIQGAMGFFSWPSKGTRAGYLSDAAAIEASEVDIANFLAAFAAQSGSDRVHVIAHSMGNRGLLRAISRIVNDASRLSKCQFTHLVLAAPDVDTKVFADLAVNFAKVAKRATLYVSDKDVLLEASSWLHDYPRAGIRPPVTLVPRVDTIDVGKVDLSFLGHSYVAAERAVLSDIFHLVHNDTAPEKRMGLTELVDPSGSKYWTFRA